MRSDLENLSDQHIGPFGSNRLNALNSETEHVKGVAQLPHIGGGKIDELLEPEQRNQH